MNTELLKHDLEKEILESLHISFLKFCKNKLEVEISVGAYLWTAFFTMASGLIAIALNTTNDIVVCLGSASCFLCLFAIFTSILIVDEIVSCTLLILALVLALVSFLISGITDGSTLAIVGAVVVGLILLAVPSNALRIWRGQNSKLLAKFRTNEEDRLILMRNYLEYQIIPKGQEEISTLTGQLDAKIEAYKNELDLELKQVRDSLTLDDSTIDKSILEKLELAILDKQNCTPPGLVAAISAKRQAQDIQNELVQLHKELQAQIWAYTPNQGMLSLIEKHLPDVYDSQAPASNIWETFEQKYLDIAERRLATVVSVSKVIGIEKQLEGSPVTRLLEEST